MFSEKAVLDKYPTEGVDPKILKNPKEQLNLYIRKLSNQSPRYAVEGFRHGNKECWR